MRTLYTIAHPTLVAQDAALIRDFRTRHDPHAGVVDAHFTLVFACSAVAEADYLAHVRAVAAASCATPFSCRYAMLGADAESASGFVFLVPDAGHAALSLLHDALYRGPLLAQLRLDIAFTPHITIGRSASRVEAKRWCDELNASGVRIDGSIAALTVGAVEDGRFREIGRYPLDAVAP